MPRGADEAAWDRAKRMVHKQYPNLSESDDAFWRIHSKLYDQMKSKKVK
jgi:outer membrane protein assembly factor BamD (BamD/ComL family)